MKTLIVSSMLFLTTSVNAQLMCSLGNSSGQQYNPDFDVPPNSRALRELRTIYQALCPTGCGQGFLASNQSVPNALALAIGNGTTKISYNPDFLNNIRNMYGGGATFGIIAHEFGHHIDFHSTPQWMNNSWSRELKADAWAGCALARVGGNTQQIENALRAIAAYPSSSHPGWRHRHQAIREGFISCSGNWSVQYNIDIK